uniref:Uncharacterized protein n=1 Tax=Anguilla anguilla TaxID=7936 RepID=A0A0E9VJM8_ANGAN
MVVKCLPGFHNEMHIKQQLCTQALCDYDSVDSHWLLGRCCPQR